MEGEREILKDRISAILIVLPHGIKQGLFVSDNEILSHMIMNPDILGVDLRILKFFEIV